MRFKNKQLQEKKHMILALSNIFLVPFIAPEPVHEPTDEPVTEPAVEPLPMEPVSEGILKKSTIEVKQKESTI